MHKYLTNTSPRAENSRNLTNTLESYYRVEQLDLIHRPVTSTIYGRSVRMCSVHCKKPGSKVHLRQASHLSQFRSSVDGKVMLPNFTFKSKSRKTPLRSAQSNNLKESPLYLKAKKEIMSRHSTFMLANKRISIKSIKEREHSPNPYYIISHKMS